MKRHAVRIFRNVAGFGLIVFAIATGWAPVFQFWIPLILGLAILAPEYKWARDLQVKAIDLKDRALARLRTRRKRKPGKQRSAKEKV